MLNSYYLKVSTPPFITCAYSLHVYLRLFETHSVVSLNTFDHFESAELIKNPVDGFSAGLVDDDNIYQWEVVVIGPQDTL